MLVNAPYGGIINMIVDNSKNCEVKRNNQRKQKGASLVEYALLVALISVAAVAAITALGTKASSTLSSATANMN